MTIETGMPGREERRPNAVLRYFARFDDGELARWAFRGLLVGAIAVLALDLHALTQRDGGLWRTEAPATDSMTTGVPVLPPAVVTGEPERTTIDPRENVLSGDDELRRPMRFELRAGGVLLAEGSIDQGAAARFAREVEQRGEYVRRISLNSPGGSLDDAMEMARIVRERGFDTEVADGAICASSCPLLMAGGTNRSAGEKAAVGLHQFYAATGTVTEPAQVMADAQMTTARISRHLAEMGVDAALWLHALDTPPRSLYYLSQEEMQRYRLVQSGSPVASRSLQASETR